MLRRRIRQRWRRPSSQNLLTSLRIQRPALTGDLAQPTPRQWPSLELVVERAALVGCAPTAPAGRVFRGRRLRIVLVALERAQDRLCGGLAATARVHGWYWGCLHAVVQACARGKTDGGHVGGGGDQGGFGDQGLVDWSLGQTAVSWRALGNDMAGCSGKGGRWRGGRVGRDLVQRGCGIGGVRRRDGRGSGRGPDHGRRWWWWEILWRRRQVEVAGGSRSTSATIPSRGHG